jgi:hypothetical protein
MEFIALPQAEWSVINRLGENAAAIDQKCQKIVQLIKEAFERDSMIGAKVCSLEILGTDHEFAVLKSPIGQGRIVRTWSHSNRNLQAELTFSREKLDQSGQWCWEPVWGLVVPLYDVAYSGTGPNALRFDLGSYTDDERHRAFSSAVSMLYGLLNGPLTSPSQ